MDYRVVYSSRRKTVEIEVRGTEVTVRAPQGVGKTTLDRLVEERRAWIERHIEKNRTLPPPPDKAEVATLRRRAEEALPPRVAYYAETMGLTPAYVKITAAKRRFGSCNGKNGLCFSLYLMQYPPEAIDYVVVHELAHIRYKDHSPAFHALIRRYLPDAAARRALLRRPPVKK